MVRTDAARERTNANPCTADFCYAENGCTHANLANGAGCGVGKVCSTGQCQ